MHIMQLQCLRSLLVMGANDNEEFSSQCHQLVGAALQTSVKDLRSQVCREACITIAYFCEKMDALHFWKVAEMVLPITINLMQVRIPFSSLLCILSFKNSAKIMSTSGINANHYIAKYIRHPRILQLILQFTTSKAKDIRK